MLMIPCIGNTNRDGLSSIKGKGCGIPEVLSAIYGGSDLFHGSLTAEGEVRLPNANGLSPPCDGGGASGGEGGPRARGNPTDIIRVILDSQSPPINDLYTIPRYIECHILILHCGC